MTVQEDRLGWFRTASGNAGRIGWLRYGRGRWRLKRGYCPVCYSSPPQSLCPVCQGSYSYGPNMTDARRDRWRARLDLLRRADS
jgi:hypothetical protein